MQHNLVCTSFEENQTESYRLSLLAGGDSFSYLIADQERRLLALRSYKRQNTDKSLHGFLGRILEGDALLALPFGRTDLAWQSAKSNLLPESLYAEADAEQILGSLIRLRADERVRSQFLPIAEGLRLLYAADGKALDLLTQRFPDLNLHHALGSLLLHYLQMPRREELRALAHLVADYWTLCIVHGNKLLYANTFKYKSATDCLYFTLAAYKYLNLQPLKNPLCLSGELLADSEIYQLLYQYLQNVSFMERPDYYSLEQVRPEALPEGHFYPELFGLVLCES